MNRIRFQIIRRLILIAFSCYNGIVLGQGVILSVESRSATVGSSVVIPINLTSLGGARVAAVQWTLSYSSDITNVAFAAGTEATNANKSIACNGNRCLIYGMNSSAIPDGTVAILTLQLSSNPSTLAIPIQITEMVAATSSGNLISVAGGSGTVSVLPAVTLTDFRAPLPA